jgi:hypothetical protein
MKKIAAFVLGILALPSIASAQVDLSNLGNAIESLTQVINALIPFFIGIAVLVFIYGIIKYVLSGGDEGARKEARNYMIFGIIGIFVMVSVWGLVNLLTGTFELDNEIEEGELPSVPPRNIP